MKSALLGCLVLLAGCGGTQTLAFPVGAFALMYGDVSHALREACDAKKIDAAKCAQLAEYDKEVRAKIVEPAKDIDWAKVGELIGVAAKLAAKGAM